MLKQSMLNTLREREGIVIVIVKRLSIQKCWAETRDELRRCM